jgi:DNA-binding CsgD family transcriptional regulator
MITDYHKYSLIFEFIKTYSPVGFKGIDRNCVLMTNIEDMMRYNNQFFFVADMIQVKILFTSERSTEIIGINPEDVNPYHFFEATHPDDLHRHNLGRSKLFGMAQGLYIAENGTGLLSSNIRIRNPEKGYSNMLFQCYLFFSLLPVKTVYIFQIITDIEWSRTVKRGFHYYVGNDISFFRFPDEALLSLGNMFSEREFEIITLIKSGLNSELIAKKLFLSIHTVNTHRTNILAKAGKSSISEVIYDLVEQGYLQ